MPTTSPARKRPDVIFKHTRIDVAVKDPSELISDIRALLHLEHAAERIRRQIKAAFKFIDDRPGQVRQSADPTTHTAAISRVYVYRRSAMEGEAEFTDWKVPDPSKHTLQTISTGEPVAAVAESLVDLYAELAEILTACVDLGEEIDKALRNAGGVPPHIDTYRAQSTSGVAGYKFDSKPRRTIDVEYRVYGE